MSQRIALIQAKTCQRVPAPPHHENETCSKFERKYMKIIEIQPPIE